MGETCPPPRTQPIEIRREFMGDDVMRVQHVSKYCREFQSLRAYIRDGKHTGQPNTSVMDIWLIPRIVMTSPRRITI